MSAMALHSDNTVSTYSNFCLNQRWKIDPKKYTPKKNYQRSTTLYKNASKNMDNLEVFETY